METIRTVVFREREGGGNPCPVTLDAGGLTAEQMRAMAADFGEECAFLSPSARSDCDIRARYFVPLHEMEMCVHATIGSTAVLVETGAITASPCRIETVLGPIEVEWERKGSRIEAGVYQFLPKFQQRNPGPQEVCQALRIDETALSGAPIQSAATSRWKLIVPLTSRTILDRLEPDFEALWALCDQYETTGFYPCVMERGSEGQPVFYARQFPKRAGYPEDPATGVAASALGAYAVDHGLIPVREGWNCCQIFQGQAMGRPSVLWADSLVQGGVITASRVRGSAVLL